MDRGDEGPAFGTETMWTVRLTPAAVRVFAVGLEILPSDETLKRLRMQ